MIFLNPLLDQPVFTFNDLSTKCCPVLSSLFYKRDIQNGLTNYRAKYWEFRIPCLYSLYEISSFWSLKSLNIFIICCLKSSCASVNLPLSGNITIGGWYLEEAYCLSCSCLCFLMGSRHLELQFWDAFCYGYLILPLFSEGLGLHLLLPQPWSLWINWVRHPSGFWSSDADWAQIGAMRS